MIIIAEKINGSIPSMGKAIAEHDVEHIKDIARRQAEAIGDNGYIDCCASVDVDEVETLHWMIDAIQEVTDAPIAVDSPSAEACIGAMKYCNKPGMINSISGEGNKMEVVLPVIADTPWTVMALLCDDSGIPKDAEGRIKVLDRIMAECKKYGIAEDRVFIDPMVEMICTAEEGISIVLDVIKYCKKTYPEVHISGAISNISFNLPYRKILNIAFVVTCMAFGMDSGVLDPLSRDLLGAIYAAECMSGEDYYCMEYISAFREGLFGPKQ